MADDRPALVTILRPGAPLPARAWIGGKASSLATLAELAAEGGFETAPFLVLSSEIFTRVRSELGEIRADIGSLDAVRRRILAQEIEPSLQRSILDALGELGLLGQRVAVRSSAAAEDGSELSFAGQFESVLNVEVHESFPDPLWDAIRTVWASTFSPHAVAYAQRVASRPDVSMAVIVQAMVEAEVSGVAFSVDPVSGDRDTALVSAVFGLGEGLVSGQVDADSYRVPRTGPIARTLVSATPTLDDAQARRIAEVARALETQFGAPQDIEWSLRSAVTGGSLVVLQSRPITALPPPPAPTQRNLWDNSNIIESYSGVTTPLTYSFALRVYEEVYLQFCRLVRVPESMLRERQQLFANMLGLARGRIYYNLLNWYRMLALLPGFRFNRSFMERMMGVRESLRQEIEVPASGSKFQDLLRWLSTTVRFVHAGTQIDRNVARFRAHVDATLLPLAREDFSTWPPDRLLAQYHQLEQELLRKWQTPIVNDFLAMIFFGVLGRLTERWLPGTPPTLVNDLLCGEGGIISTEPARRVMGLAAQVQETPRLRALFASELDATAIWQRLATEPEHAAFHGELCAYLDRFGDRCMEELKLETVTLGEDPTPLVFMVRAYLAAKALDPQQAWQREISIRQAAEANVRKQLNFWKYWIYLFVLRRARARVRDRENLRFARTRVFGVVRRMYKGLGSHLAVTGRLERADDVFYLQHEELFGLFEDDLELDTRILTRQRREEFAEYARTPAPPDRFETQGAADTWKPGDSGAPMAMDPNVQQLSGTGCCPGVVRARVRIVRDPRDADQLSGRILVAERTDPGWTLLFPVVSGLLVQRGSLLSHSAIVAREMGIPCIVGIAGLMDVLRDGEEVAMDGTLGTVVRQAASAATP